SGPYRGPVPAAPRARLRPYNVSPSLPFYMSNGWTVAAETREARTMASRLKVALPLLCAAALVLAGLPLAEPTHAGTITVNTSGKAAGMCPATCTLRAAIAAANPGDTIMFQAGLASPIILGSELAINTNITISGPGAATLAVSGNGHRIFNIGNVFVSTV